MAVSAPPAQSSPTSGFTASRTVALPLSGATAISVRYVSRSSPVSIVGTVTAVSRAGW